MHICNGDYHYSMICTLYISVPKYDVIPEDKLISFKYRQIEIKVMDDAKNIMLVLIYKKGWVAMFEFMYKRPSVDGHLI